MVKQQDQHSAVFKSVSSPQPSPPQRPWQPYEKNTQKEDGKLNFNRIVPACALEILGQHDPLPAPELRQKVPGIGGIFVLHYPKLVDRWEDLNSRLDASGLSGSTTWVTWLNKETFFDMNATQHRCLFDVNSIWFAGGRKKRVGGRHSIGMKHLWVWFHTMRHKLNNVIVMEDDAGIKRDIVAKLTELAEELKVVKGYATVQLSNCGFEGANHREVHARLIHSVEGTAHLYGPGYGSRCASGYVISEHGAGLLLNRTFLGGGINAMTDHYMNGVVDVAGYWYEPKLWEQTSEESSY